MTATIERRTGYGTHFHLFHEPASWINRGVGGELSASRASTRVTSGSGASGWSVVISIVALLVTIGVPVPLLELLLLALLSEPEEEERFSRS